MRFFLLVLFSGLILNAADTKHIEMDYGDALFMSLDTNSPEGEQMVRKALVQRLATQALPDRGTPIGKGRVIKVKDDIDGTELDKIYQYQRERSTGYLISVPDGEYKITLQFAEIKRKNTGERVFDILLQQKKVKSDFDPLEVAGAQFKAVDVVVDKVKIKKFLRLEFVQKSTRSTPAIAGIVIEGKNFTKKINCGGDKEGDYEEDWDKKEYMEDPFSTGIIFDTELLRYSAAWINGFVKLKGTAYDATHGTHPEIQGDQIWGSGYVPGWIPEGKNAVDPRKDHLGHLSKDWAHYKGFYRHEEGNVIKYTVAGSEVLDKIELLKVPAKVAGQAYVRTVQAENLSAASDMLILEVPGENVKFTKTGTYFKSEQGFLISLKGLKADSLKAVSRKIGDESFTSVFVNVPKGKNHFSVAVFKTDADSEATFENTFAGFNTPNLNSFTKGGALRWEGKITVAGVKGKDEGPFTVDEIVMPENNPWRSWMRPGAFDFTADGKSMYMSTWSGDVWRADNLDDISKLTWKRYAAGLFHPLGLKIVDGKIYVQCRDGISILHDLNKDGEADFYENFNNDVVITENFHEFSFELHRDKEGNFYFVKGAPVVAGGEGFGEMQVHHGKLFKVSPDGSKLEVIASGFRAPNGMGMSPDGQLTTSDNEGNWVAATPVNWIEKGGFYGVQPTYAGDKAPEKRSSIVCWIPHKVDNSAGGQVWIPKGEWGPYGGEMFHISYGQAKLFHVLKETVNGQIQGGVVDLKPTGGFEAGIMRGRFNTTDKAVYLAGLKGWQTKGIKDGGVYRVRYTGQKKCRPVGLSVGKNGIKVTFTEPVKPESALDAGNYDVSQWVYEISDKYGSKHYKVPKGRDWALQSDWSPLPKEELDKFAKLKFKDEAAKKAALTQLYDKYVGEDQVKISSISLSDDKKTVFLEIPDIAPVMQMKVSFDIESEGGSKVKNDIYQTIHKLGDWKGTPGKKILTSDLSKPKSGLIAVFKHKGQNKTDARIQRMAAFYIGEKTPVTQFLDHGLFETNMEGFIKAERNMKAKFFAVGSGKATMSINGAIVFRDNTFSEDKPYEIQLKKGFNKLNINYTSPEKGSAYFRLYWEAIEYFPKEPVPASVLFHEGGNKNAIAANLKRSGLNLAIDKNCFSCHDTGRDVKLPELLSGKISLNELGSRLNTAWV
ncbi:MAG: malectin domain-containing carbohydrate-binding protein, partial [Lentisphaeraceae bacterium]|nr:malectin domain-containing carbohydrate-binding protein [Lentisphaeraceae bacterium]